MWGVRAKGVGRGPTLAWPGWKQPDISVKVDTARLEAGQLKKCCMECALLYYPVLNSRVLLMYTDTVKELPGYPVQNSPSWSFLFWGGSVGRGGLVYDIVRRGCPRRTPWTTCVHLYAFVFYRRHSPPFQFSLSGATLVYLSQWCGLPLAVYGCAHKPYI